MSYSRWSNSVWYAFYNTENKLSLWYDMDNLLEWDYHDLVDMITDEETCCEQLVLLYDCTLAEAQEALDYIDDFICDYEADREKDPCEIDEWRDFDPDC